MFKRPDWMNFDKFKKARKSAADELKKYLRGQVIAPAGGVKIKGRIKTHNTKKLFKRPSFLKKRRALRKTRNKMAYVSRRVNRLRKA